MLRPTSTAIHPNLLCRAVKLSAPAPSQFRTLITSHLLRSAGDQRASSSHPSSERNGDIWTSREHAGEENWIRNEEKSRLRLMKRTTTQGRKHLDDVGEFIRIVGQSDDVPKVRPGVSLSPAEQATLRDYVRMKDAHVEAMRAHREVEKHIDDLLKEAGMLEELT